MEKYAAYLRAVNVGGSKIIKMEDLRKSFTSFGMRDVQTCISRKDETLHIAFLKEKPDKKTAQSILAFKSKADEFAVHGREIFNTAPRQGWIRVSQRLHRKTDRRARHHPKLGHDL